MKIAPPLQDMQAGFLSEKLRAGHLAITIDKLSARDMIENSAKFHIEVRSPAGETLALLYEGRIREGQTVFFTPCLGDMVKVSIT